jgi:hypothetical protein
MSSVSRRVADAVASAYDFSTVASVLDVGGGQGVLLTTILQAYPTLRGVVFDTPGVIEGARARIAAAGLADRCEAIDGNFFESVPPGHDLYLLQNVMNSFGDAQNVALLASCREAVPAHGRLLIVEGVIPDDIGALSGDPEAERAFEVLMVDLNMMAVTGGACHTEAEFRALLARAGLALQRSIPTTTYMRILEAVPR